MSRNRVCILPIQIVGHREGASVMAVASLYAAIRCLDVKNFRTLLGNLDPDVPWVSLRLVVAGPCKLSATDAFMRILARHDRTFLNIDLGNMGIPLGLAVLNASFGLVDCLLFEGVEPDKAIWSQRDLLVVATTLRNSKMARVLLQAGAKAGILECCVQSMKMRRPDLLLMMLPYVKDVK